MSHLPAVAVIGVAAGGLALLHSLKRKRGASPPAEREADRSEGDAAGMGASAGTAGAGEGDGQLSRGGGGGRHTGEIVEEDGASAGACDEGGEEDAEEADDASSLALLKNEFQRSLVPPSRIDLDLDNFPYFLRYTESPSSSYNSRRVGRTSC